MVGTRVASDYFMLELVFSEASGVGPITLGPMPAFRIEGPVIRESRGAPVRARHANHLWELDGRKFFRIDCSGPLTVSFEDERGQAGDTFGSYQHFSTADGIAYVDRIHFASYAEPTGLWFCKIAGGSWPVMVVQAA